MFLPLLILSSSAQALAAGLPLTVIINKVDRLILVLFVCV
jgi:hypothetical protein